MLQLCKAAIIISGSWNMFMNLKDVSGCSTKNSLFLEQQPPVGQGLRNSEQHAAKYNRLTEQTEV